MIVALFSDEVLFEHLVLKGGNALELVHNLVSRGSIDIDLSIIGDFGDVLDARGRIFSALRRAFSVHGITLFDEKFEIVPSIRGDDPLPWWGGYRIEFKLIDSADYSRLSEKQGAIQRQAIPIDDHQGRTFRIDISKHEYCRDKVAAELDGQTIYVYSEEMCVFEKIRSLCQQLPGYVTIVGKKASPRARDFYDIYSVITKRALDIALLENLDLCRAIFAAKHVPLSLIPKIAGTRCEMRWWVLRLISTSTLTSPWRRSRS